MPLGRNDGVLSNFSVCWGGGVGGEVFCFRLVFCCFGGFGVKDESSNLLIVRVWNRCQGDVMVCWQFVFANKDNCISADGLTIVFRVPMYMQPTQVPEYRPLSSHKLIERGATYLLLATSKLYVVPSCLCRHHDTRLHTCTLWSVASLTTWQMNVAKTMLDWRSFSKVLAARQKAQAESSKCLSSGTL